MHFLFFEKLKKLQWRRQWIYFKNKIYRNYNLINVFNTIVNKYQKYPYFLLIYPLFFPIKCYYFVQTLVNEYEIINI